MAEKAAKMRVVPDEISIVNEKLKAGGESTFKAILKTIDAGGRIIMIGLVIVTAIINGTWAGIREIADGIARGMREIDRDLSK
jgi:hypothetical protein